MAYRPQNVRPPRPIAAGQPQLGQPTPAAPPPPVDYPNKGAPIPGQTVRPPAPATGAPAPSAAPVATTGAFNWNPDPAPTGVTPPMPNETPTPGAPGTTAPGTSPTGAPGKPPNISDRAWKSHNEINSTISLEQWQAWDQFADPSCPPNKPYRSQKTIGGAPGGSCEETPDNCPPGYQAYGQNECRTNEEVARITGGGAGGAGGGAGGAGGAGGGGSSGSGLFGDENKLLWEQLMKRLNMPSRYTPGGMAGILGEQKTGAEANAQNQLRESNADLASRGLARSGIGAGAARDISMNAGNQALAAKNQIVKAKIDADYEDQTATLTAMQNWLNASRQAVLQQQATEEQKRQAMAQIALQYAQLQAQFDMLREEYAQKISVIGLGL